MQVGRRSGDVFFNPAYGDSTEHLPGFNRTNVIPLEVVYENTSFKHDHYKNSEFVQTPKKNGQGEDQEEDYVNKSQLLLFLKKNNLLNKANSEDGGTAQAATEQPAQGTRRSSASTESSVSIK